MTTSSIPPSAAPSGPTRLAARLRSRGTYPRWVLVTALAGMFATTFPITILAVTIPELAADFGVTEPVMTWVVSAPMLTSAVAMPILGKLGDLYGHRRVYLTGFTIATAVAALTATAWDATALVGLRTIAAVLGGATQPTAAALVMGVFEREDRVKAMGWWSFVAAGAPAVGLVAGGPLIDTLGWRSVFVAQAVLAAVALVFAALVLPTTRGRPGVRFDVPGALTLAFGTGAVMFALTQSVDWGWSSPTVLVALAAAPLGFVAFVRRERATEHPLLPLELLRIPTFSAPIVAAWFQGAAYTGAFVLAPLVLDGVFGLSVAAAAGVMVLRTLTYSLSSPLGGRLGHRVGERRGAMIGAAALAASMLVIATGAGGDLLVVFGIGLVVQGLGNGLGRPSLIAAVANSVPEHDLGMAAAANRMAYQVGSAFGITVLVATAGSSGDPAAFARGYLVGAVLATCGLAAAWFARSHRDATEPGATPASPAAASRPA